MARSRTDNQAGWRGSFDRIAGQHLMVILFLAISTIGVFGLYVAINRNTQRAATQLPALSSVAVSPDNSNVQIVVQRHINSNGPMSTRIALVSGHLNFDSGAVCPDGLQEVDVNWGITTIVRDSLRARGINAEIFEEYDGRLEGYDGRAVLGIQADVCTGDGSDRSGYKVAAKSTGVSGTLLVCIQNAYSGQTNLAYDSNTITPDMTQYHVFDKVAPNTAAAIIETGYMSTDRELLTTNKEIPAQAIVDGILCFLEQTQ